MTRACFFSDQNLICNYYTFTIDKPLMMLDPLMQNVTHDKLCFRSSISVRHPVVYWTEAPALREAKCTDIIQFKPLPLTSPQQPKFPKRTFFRHRRRRQNLLLSDLTLDYQLSTLIIITIQLMSRCLFFMNDFYFQITELLNNNQFDIKCEMFTLKL